MVENNLEVKPMKTKCLKIDPTLTCEKHYQTSIVTGKVGIRYTIYNLKGSICTEDSAHGAWASVLKILRKR